MKRLLWLAILLPMTAFAQQLEEQVNTNTNGRVGNTQRIENLEAGQIVQDDRIIALELTDPVPGPQGPTGTAGADGATGATGPQGPAGIDGVDLTAEVVDLLNRVAALESAGTPPPPEPEPIPAGVQAQIVWALDLAATYQDDVQAFYDANGYFPIVNFDLGLPAPADMFKEDLSTDPNVTDYGPLSALFIGLNGPGTIMVRFGDSQEPWSAAAGLEWHEVVWTADDLTGVLLWTCSTSTGIDPTWMPATCQ